MTRQSSQVWQALWLLVMACNGPSGGGPISDFPIGGEDNDPPGAGDGDSTTGDGDYGDGDTGDGDTGEGDGDSSSGDGDLGDGDEPAPGDGDGDSDGDPPGEADAGWEGPTEDGGVPRDDADGGPSEGDGGVTCTSSSDGRPDACYGLYCTTTAAQLSEGKTEAAACGDQAELALVCDGQVARVAQQCVEDHVLGDNLASDVRSCLRAESTLAMAGDDCLECYAAEVLCTLEYCVSDGLSGDVEAFEGCRKSNCADAFYACSGLPRPE